MFPRARRSGTRVREVGGQLAVFDEETDRLHILNPAAAVVWQHCDGQFSTDDLALIVAGATSSIPDEDLVRAALDELEEAGLLEPRTDAAVERMSRQRMLKGAAAGVAAGAALPTVISFWLSSPGSASASRSKVQICHKGRTIWVNENAVQAHLNHGDTLGPCGGPTTTTGAPTTTTFAPTTTTFAPTTTTFAPTTTTFAPTTTPSPP
jgi:hypothetical protein